MKLSVLLISFLFIAPAALAQELPSDSAGDEVSVVESGSDIDGEVDARPDSTGASRPDPAPMPIRVGVSLARASMVASYVVWDAERNGEPLWASAVPLGFISGSASGLIQFFNHKLQAFFRHRDFIYDRLPIHNRAARWTFNAIEQTLKGYGVEMTYVLVTSVGVVIFSAESASTMKSFVQGLFLTSFSGFMAQTIFELRFADRVEKLKDRFSEAKRRVQAGSDLLVGLWAMFTVGAQVAQLTNQPGANEILAGLTLAGAVYYVADPIVDKVLKITRQSRIASWLGSCRRRFRG